jgi:hypothetical protein
MNLSYTNHLWWPAQDHLKQSEVNDMTRILVAMSWSEKPDRKYKDPKCQIRYRDMLADNQNVISAYSLQLTRDDI